jgi:alpha-D-ribose 1-methylphosphonate 5-triphosphate synthase subunit PhnG
MVMGDHKELAFIIAAVDSALQMEDNLFLSELDRLLEPASLRMQESLNIEKKFVSSTKVNFGLMVEG